MLETRFASISGTSVPGMSGGGSRTPNSFTRASGLSRPPCLEPGRLGEESRLGEARDVASSAPDRAEVVLLSVVGCGRACGDQSVYREEVRPLGARICFPEGRSAEV